MAKHLQRLRLTKQSIIAPLYKPQAELDVTLSKFACSFVFRVLVQNLVLLIRKEFLSQIIVLAEDAWRQPGEGIHNNETAHRWREKRARKPLC